MHVKKFLENYSCKNSRNNDENTNDVLEDGKRSQPTDHMEQQQDESCNHVGSFIGNFVWKGKDSPVLSKEEEEKAAWCNCRLDCPVMKIGWKYQWTIRAEDIKDDQVAVGIASSTQELSLERFLGYQKCAWCYVSYGEVWHNRTGAHLSKYKSGTVTLTLDLSSVQENQKTGGKLSAKIEGKSDEVMLFDNVVGDGIKIGMNFSDGDGFYPAVYVGDGSSLEFVKFEYVKK